MTADELNQIPTNKLVALFKAAQEVQKRNRPDSDASQMASVAIHVLAPMIAKRDDAHLVDLQAMERIELFALNGQLYAITRTANGRTIIQAL